MKKLIVTADDFGLTDRVNEAIAIAAQDGIVTTASWIVTGGGFESAIDIARSRPALDLGLHLNLTEGSPVSHYSSIPSLATAGGFRYTHPSRLAMAILFRKVTVSDLERESRSQIEKAMRTGLPISHIDGHKHVHAIPAVLDLISKIVPEYGIRAIRSVDETVPALREILSRNRGSRSQIVEQYGFSKLLSLAWTASTAFNRDVSLVTPDRFFGVTQTGFLDFKAFEEIVNQLGDGFNEVMCHPGYMDRDLERTPTRLREQRERELELLIGADLRHLIRKAGIALLSYRDLPGCQASTSNGTIREDYGRHQRNSLLHRDSTL